MRVACRLIWILLAVAFGPLSGRLQGDVVTLLSGSDTRLHEQNPTNNEGGFFTLVSGTQGPLAGATRNRALLRFDPGSAIPPNSEVHSAQLLLTVVMTPFGAADSTFELHRVLKPWAENEATWEIRLAPDIAWDAPGAAAGADYSETVSATQFIAGLGGYTFDSTADLVADVQAWLDDPGANFGWILVSQSEAVQKTARHFASRENATSPPPQLIVEFTPPPRIDRAEIVGTQILLHFQVEAGKSYVVESRPCVSTGEWTVVTNLPPQGIAADLVVSDSVGPTNGFYRIVRR